MENSSTENVLTMGHFFDFFLSSKQAKTMKELTSAQAMEAYRKGFLHQIPSSSTEQGRMTKTSLVLVEMDSPDIYKEYSVRGKGPQNTLNRHQFLSKYFPMEKTFSWLHLPEDEYPVLPIFVVGSRVEETAYRICEFKNEEEALKFIEATAKGLKNLAANLLKDNSLALATLAQISEFQIIHGIRVLLYRMLEKPVSPRKIPVYYYVWWSHENLVFAAAPPVQVILSKDREHFLSGSLENDKEYEKGLALLNAYRKYSNRLRKRTEPEEMRASAKIQDFDHWNWSLSNTTPISALARRTILIFPMSIAGNEVTEFRISQITPVRKGFFGALRSGSPPKAVYAKYWNETKRDGGWMSHLLAKNSKLPSAKDRLQILLDAFNNGPPIAYINAHYGSNIAASMLFFKKDFKGPLHPDEDYRHDEWKTVFGNTLRIKYGHASKLPFISTKIPKHAQNKGLVGLFWAIFRMDVSREPLTKEYIWVWPDEFGFCFLDAIDADNQTIGNEFLRLLSFEKEKALRVVFEEGKEAKKALLNKIEHFLARLKEK